MLSINFSLSIKTYRRRGRTQCICQSPITQTSHKDERLNYHALAPSLLQAHTHTDTHTPSLKHLNEEDSRRKLILFACNLQTFSEESFPYFMYSYGLGRAQ